MQRLSAGQRQSLCERRWSTCDSVLDQRRHCRGSALLSLTHLLSSSSCPVVPTTHRRPLRSPLHTHRRPRPVSFCSLLSLSPSLPPSSMSHSPVLCAFDVGHRHFVCVTADNRIKLWNVVTGHLIHHYSEPHHLTTRYTSLVWTSSLPTPPVPSPPLGYLALGTHTGGVSVFNLTTGDCTRPSSTPSTSSATPVHSSPITAVTLHASILYTATADSQLHRYAFPSLTFLSSIATPAPVTLMPVMGQKPAGLLVAMGAAMAELNTDSPTTFTLTRRWAEVGGDICSVAASEDGKTLATGQSSQHTATR